MVFASSRVLAYP